MATIGGFNPPHQSSLFFTTGMAAETVFTHARIVTAEEVIVGTVLVRDGRIRALHQGATAVRGTVDLEGDLLIPGLVELHTDNFERHLLPRPNASWPALPALLQHDAEMAAAGVTTVHDALCVGNSDLCGLRGRNLADLVEALDAAVQSGLLKSD